MDARRTNFLLRTVSLASLVGAATILVVAAIVPRPRPAKLGGTVTAATTRATVVDTMPTPRAFVALGEPTLRRSLVEAAKPSKPPVDLGVPPSTFGLSLRGTILEPGRPLAVFATGTGETRMCGIGERVDGGEVTAITAGDVTLRFDGRPLVLKVPAPPTGALGT